MSSPRHLWSGDWELDSTAAAEELARRRAQIDEPAGTPEPSPPRARPSAAARPDRRWQLRVALLTALVTLLGAGAIYGVARLVIASGGQASAGASTAHPWLGVDVVGSPLGIMVADVAPGSPAAKAGLEPGDLITQIAGQPIGTVDGVNAVLAGLRAGEPIEIQFTRGLISYTARATLGAMRSGAP